MRQVGDCPWVLWFPQQLLWFPQQIQKHDITEIWLKVALTDKLFNKHKGMYVTCHYVLKSKLHISHKLKVISQHYSLIYLKKKCASVSSNIVSHADNIL